MKVEFLNKFSKDIDRIHLKSVKNNLIKLIDQIELLKISTTFQI